MRRTDYTELSFDEFDELNTPRPEETDFDRVVERAISRRGFLKGGAAVGASAFVLATSALSPVPARAAGRIDFEAVEANTMDTITLPEGYNWHVVTKWGDPLWSNSIPFDQATRGTGESQELAFGDNNDGMTLFSADGRHILAVNCEYTNRDIIYGNRETKLPENDDDVRKGKAAHGITVVEIAQDGDSWSIVKDSPYNRRITADTPMEITGPARRHDLLKTAADPSGTTSLGTWNNCANGSTS